MNSAAANYKTIQASLLFLVAGLIMLTSGAANALSLALSSLPGGGGARAALLR